MGLFVHDFIWRCCFLNLKNKMVFGEGTTYKKDRNVFNKQNCHMNAKVVVSLRSVSLSVCLYVTVWLDVCQIFLGAKIWGKQIVGSTFLCARFHCRYGELFYVLINAAYPYLVCQTRILLLSFIFRDFVSVTEFSRPFTVWFFSTHCSRLCRGFSLVWLPTEHMGPCNDLYAQTSHK